MYLIPIYSGSTFVAYTKALHVILRVGQKSHNKVYTEGEPGNEATILPRTVHMPHTMYCNGCTLLPCQQAMLSLVLSELHIQHSHTPEAE